MILIWAVVFQLAVIFRLSRGAYEGETIVWRNLPDRIKTLMNDPETELTNRKTNGAGTSASVQNEDGDQPLEFFWKINTQAPPPKSKSHPDIGPNSFRSFLLKAPSLNQNSFEMILDDIRGKRIRGKGETTTDRIDFPAIYVLKPVGSQEFPSESGECTPKVAQCALNRECAAPTETTPKNDFKVKLSFSLNIAHSNSTEQSQSVE